jgi:hypothetical protein
LSTALEVRFEKGENHEIHGAEKPQEKPEFAAKEHREQKDFTTDFTEGRRGNEELTEKSGT